MYNNSKVHCMMIDASQAFDKVHYVKLFELLLEKGLCPIVARFLATMYTQQQLRVKWGSHLSHSFRVKNGVKQGGVLSPILFSVYMDKLLNLLEKSGYGCYIGTMFLGALGYADDVTVMAPTYISLKFMLKIVSEFGKEYHVKFNPSKSQFIVFSKNDMNVITQLF